MDLRNSLRKNPGLLAPWRRYERVEQIDPHELAAQGVRLVLLDRDNTLVPRDGVCAPASVQLWLFDLASAGIDTVMVSNNFHAQAVERSAGELGLEAIPKACKPLPFALRRAIRLTGHRVGETVMVGDQLFTDVVAGSLAGVRTILVSPQSTKDLWYTRILRRVEEPLAGRVPLYSSQG
jgi:HAD superfamily phosphatase (TIGR01668 family)